MDEATHEELLRMIGREIQGVRSACEQVANILLVLLLLVLAGVILYALFLFGAIEVSTVEL